MYSIRSQKETVSGYDRIGLGQRSRYLQSIFFLPAHEVFDHATRLGEQKRLNHTCQPARYECVSRTLSRERRQTIRTRLFSRLDGFYGAGRRPPHQPSISHRLPGLVAQRMGGPSGRWASAAAASVRSIRLATWRSNDPPPITAAPIHVLWELAGCIRIFASSRRGREGEGARNPDMGKRKGIHSQHGSRSPGMTMRWENEELLGRQSTRPWDCDIPHPNIFGTPSIPHPPHRFCSCWSIHRPSTVNCAKNSWERKMMLQKYKMLYYWSIFISSGQQQSLASNVHW